MHKRSTVTRASILTTFALLISTLLVGLTTTPAGAITASKPVAHANVATPAEDSVDLSRTVAKDPTDCRHNYNVLYCNIVKWLVSSHPSLQNGRYTRMVTNLGARDCWVAMNSNGLYGHPVRLNSGQTKFIGGRLANGITAQAFLVGECGPNGTKVSGGVYSPNYGKLTLPTAHTAQLIRSGRNLLSHSAVLQINNGTRGFTSSIRPGQSGTVATSLPRGQFTLVYIVWANRSTIWPVDARYIYRP